MTKFIKHGSKLININNITYFHAKVIAKKRHEIFEEDLYTFKENSEIHIEGYVIHVYFIGDTYDDIKLYFDTKNEIEKFINNFTI